MAWFLQSHVRSRSATSFFLRNKRGDVTKNKAGRSEIDRFARVALSYLLLIGFASPVGADLLVPANSLVSVNGGTIDLGCTDLVVGGTLQLGSGRIVNARNVTIQAGGLVNGGSGIVEFGGDWSNAGTFAAGTSSVRFEDLCGAAGASITGNTTFADVRFVTATGRDFVFAVGSTQTINSLLQISGTAANPIQFRSSAPGQVANINLQGGGTQQIQHVGVTDVWATGQTLAPSLTNEGGGGNAKNWFGGGPPPPPSVAPIPTLGDFATALLAVTLAWLAAVELRARRRSTRRRSGISI